MYYLLQIVNAIRETRVQLRKLISKSGEQFEECTAADYELIAHLATLLSNNNSQWYESQMKYFEEKLVIVSNNQTEVNMTGTHKPDVSELKMIPYPLPYGDPISIAVIPDTIKCLQPFQRTLSRLEYDIFQDLLLKIDQVGV